MDFDEYEYLEKTVEKSDDKTDKTHRRRETEDTNFGERRKRSRGATEEENGAKRESSRYRSDEKERREKERPRSDEREREREKERPRRSRSREGGDKERETRDRERREKEREGGDKERLRSYERERDRERRERSRRSRSRHEEGDIERIEKERSRRSRSRHEEVGMERREREVVREKERELDSRDGSRRFKDKKEAEPEADPERDQRTVFAYQMSLKATERDVYEFFSKAGKVRDVRLIMDRNSRRSKGFGYIEFYDVMSVPMAIAMTGQLLLGQPVMVKPSEAEKNLVQSTATGGGSVTGPYGAVDRKLYVGNLHFNMTELQLKQVFEAFGPVEVVQLPTDPETGHCKGFGFIQFSQLEHAKAAQSLNGNLEIAGRVIKVSSVTDHIGVQDSVVKATDLDDDDGGGLTLNAQSRALLMQRLDRSGIATSVTGSIGMPSMNDASFAMNGLSTISAQALPALMTPMVMEPIGKPSECLLLKNMFDPATETDPEFDLDIKDDVQEECSKYGRVKHIHVDKNTSGYVYLRFESVEGASGAQQAMHHRWFARRLISAVFLQPYEYDAKFKGAA